MENIKEILTLKEQASKVTEIEMLPHSFGCEVKVVGCQVIQIQFVDEENGIDSYMDLGRIEARRLAKAIIEHCDIADYNNKLKYGN